MYLDFSRVESQFIMAALEQETCSVLRLVFKHCADIKQLIWRNAGRCNRAVNQQGLDWRTWL